MKTNQATLFLLSFTLLSMISCQDKQAMTELKSLKAQKALVEQNKSVVQRYWDGKWNERRPGILDELQTKDVVYHGTSGTMNGIEEYKQAYAGYLSAFQDTKVEIEELIAEGDLVMSQMVMHGKQNGSLGELPPTGKEISVSFFTMFRLVDGKIAEEWEIFDELGLMTQLGMELKPKK